MIRLAAFIGALILAQTGISFAQSQDFSRLNAWQVRCEAEGPCQIFYEIRRSGRQVSRILIYRVGDASVLEYKIPLGIDLREGVVLDIDGLNTYPTDLLTCKADGCVGFQILHRRLLNAMGDGTELRVRYVDSDSSRRQDMIYSLLGFSASYLTFVGK